MGASSHERLPYPWILLLLEGVVSVGIGVAMLFLREPTLQIARWLLGVYLLTDGTLALFATLSNTSVGRRASLLVRGALFAIGGLLLLSDWFHPVIRVSTLALLSIAIVSVALGVIGLIQSARGAGWGVAVFGIMALLLAFYVWRYSPALFSYFITVMGALVIIFGAATVVLAIRMGRRAGTDRPILVRHPVLGLLRSVAILSVMVVGLSAALPAWLMPMHHNGMKLHYWTLTYTCRVINWILRVEVLCDDKERLLEHTGIVFANHVSLLDMSTLLAVEPMRFLSTSEVFRIPFIGWMADSITTVFVDRSSSQSRTHAREQISKRVTRSANPPFVIFPEGRFGTPTSLKPYHRGAFEIAAASSVSYLPVALKYERPDIALWSGVKEEHIIVSIWRILTFKGSNGVSVIPLEIVEPTPTDNSIDLAANAQRATEAALGFAPSPTSLQDE